MAVCPKLTSSFFLSFFQLTFEVQKPFGAYDNLEYICVLCIHMGGYIELVESSLGHRNPEQASRRMPHVDPLAFLKHESTATSPLIIAHHHPPISSLKSQSISRYFISFFVYFRKRVERSPWHTFRRKIDRAVFVCTPHVLKAIPIRLRQGQNMLS